MGASLTLSHSLSRSSLALRIGDVIAAVAGDAAGDGDGCGCVSSIFLMLSLIDSFPFLF